MKIPPRGQIATDVEMFAVAHGVEVVISLRQLEAHRLRVNDGVAALAAALAALARELDLLGVDPNTAIRGFPDPEAI